MPDRVNFPFQHVQKAAIFDTYYNSSSILFQPLSDLFHVIDSIVSRNMPRWTLLYDQGKGKIIALQRCAVSIRQIVRQRPVLWSCLQLSQESKHNEQGKNFKKCNKNVKGSPTRPETIVWEASTGTMSTRQIAIAVDTPVSVCRIQKIFTKWTYPQIAKGSRSSETV